MIIKWLLDASASISSAFANQERQPVVSHRAAHTGWPRWATSCFETRCFATLLSMRSGWTGWWLGDAAWLQVALRRVFEESFESCDAGAVAVEPLPVGDDVRPQLLPPGRIPGDAD